MFVTIRPNKPLRRTLSSAANGINSNGSSTQQMGSNRVNVESKEGEFDSNRVDAKLNVEQLNYKRADAKSSQRLENTEKTTRKGVSGHEIQSKPVFSKLKPKTEQESNVKTLNTRQNKTDILTHQDYRTLNSSMFRVGGKKR